MRKFFLIAAILLSAHAAHAGADPLASSTAHAQYEFQYGGRTIRIDPDRGTVSIPGVYDNTGRKSKRARARRKRRSARRPRLHLRLPRRLRPPRRRRTPRRPTFRRETPRLFCRPRPHRCRPLRMRRRRLPRRRLPPPRRCRLRSRLYPRRRSGTRTRRSASG